MVTAEPEPAEYVEPPREITADLDFPLLFDWAEPIVEWIIERILEISHTVLEGIQNLWGATWEKIHDWVGKIWGLISDVTSQFWQWSYSQIRFLVDWAADEIPERVRGLVATSTTTMVNIFGAAQDAIAGAITRLGEDFLIFWKDRYLGYFRDMAHKIAVVFYAFFTAGIVRHSPPTDEELDRLSQVRWPWGSWMQEQLAKPIAAFIASAGEYAKGVGITAPPRVVTPLGETVEQATTAASGLVTLGVTGLSGLIGMALLGETIGFWKHVGVSQLSAIIWDASSFRIITGAFIGAIAWAVIRQPLRYNINALLRPNLPDLRDISEMYAKKEITTPEFDQAMAYMGIPDDWLDVYHRYIWRDPRLFEVVRIAEISVPEPICPDWAKEWLTTAGLEKGIGPDWWYWVKFGKGAYDSTDIEILVKVAKMAVARREQTLYLTQIRRLAREGYIDATRIRTLLEDAWVPTPPIEFREAGIALEGEYEVKADLSTSLLMALARGLITETECSQQLTQLGMRSDLVATAILRQKLGLIARPAMMRITPPEEGMAYPEEWEQEIPT